MKEAQSLPPDSALPDRKLPDRPKLALVTIAFGVWLFILSGGIANIALPRLAVELGVPQAEIVWVSIAFQVAAVSLTIPLAALAEIVGMRRVYVAGLLIYMLGAIACGLATGFLSLTVARVLQGMGAAGISAVNAALVRRIVPPHRLGRGVASLAVVLGAAQGAAPIVGSLIIEFAHWRWLFFYDIPLGVLTVFMAMRFLPADNEEGRKFDYISAILCVPAMGLSFFALDRLTRASSDPRYLLLLSMGIAAGFLLIRRQRGRDLPLFPTDLLRLPTFALLSSNSVSAYGAQALALTVMPFILVGSFGMQMLEAGAVVSLLPLATLITAPLAGYLIDRQIHRPFNAIGSAIIGLGFGVALVGLSYHDRGSIILAIIMIGIGFAFFQSHNAKAMMLFAPTNRMGAAGGIQSTVRVIGQMLGPAMVGISFHAFGTQGLLVALAIGCGLALSGAMLGTLASRVGKVQSRHDVGS